MVSPMDRGTLGDRHLSWDGCYNVRDLGGLPTSDGGVTRSGSIVRADLLRRLSATGREALLAYGVRTIIDLRTPGELVAEPYTILGPAYCNLSLDGGDPQVGAMLTASTSRAELYGLVLEHYAPLIVAVMRVIAAAEPGGVVIHCHAGKDRTGIIAALLLGLAEVPAELIAEDYGASQARLWPLYEQLVAEAGGDAAQNPWLKPVAEPETMRALLARLDERYGGVGPYLAASGLSEGELAALVRRLR
jgi:protein-tyrosine phosphatase